MAESLKNKANRLFGDGEEIDRIVEMPITGLRMELKQAFRQRNFTQEQFDDFVSRIAALPDVDIAAEKMLVDEAIRERRVAAPLDINLSSPARQLLWAAALTRIMQLGEEPVVHSGIWKQLQETSAARDEMIRTGRVVYASLQNDDTSVSWGQPGSWFYHDPKKNHINLDFYFTLLTGFEHVRAANLHEIGHSELSNKYTPRMQELYGKLEKFLDPKTGALNLSDKMPMEEQKELALVAKEWELRFDFWHMVEDNCVNQFSANMSQNYPQDFGYSMNHCAAILQGIGELARGDREDIALSSHTPKALTEEQKKKLDEMKEKIREKVEFVSRPLTAGEVQKIVQGDISPELAEKMFNEIKQTVWMSFYEHNGMFKGKDKTWERFRIFPRDIRGTVSVPEQKDPFSHLVDLSAGKQGINTLQPQPKDRYFGAPHYRAKIAETTDTRVQVMGHIWDLYLDKFAQVLMQQFQQELEQDAEQSQDQDGEEQDGQDGQGQGQGQGQGEGQEGEGQEEGQPGQGQGQGQGQSQGQSQGQGQGQGQPKSMSEALKDKIKNMKATPEDKRSAERDPGNDNAGAGEGDKKKDPEKAGGKGWEQDPSADKGQEEQKVGDLRQKDIIDEMTDEQKEAMKEAAKSAGKPGDAQSTQAGTSRDLDLSKLAKGDWKDFNRRVLELAPIINAVARDLIHIRDEQKKQVMRQSKNLDYMAEDGDIQGRLDREKMMDTKLKRATHAPLKEDDLKKFQEDISHVNESTIELFQMIDGSGSMPGLRLTNDTTAMDVALQSAVIMYMACRKAGIDGYIMMWGDAEPLMIARPDSNLKEVGELLETLRKGGGWGTSLAPALEKSILEMSAHRNKNGTISGSSHVQVYSDGDINDDDAARKGLEIMARNGKNLTVDVAVLRPQADGGHQTAMEQMVEGVIRNTRSKMIGVMRGDDANKIPRDLVRTILRRVRHIEVKTEPDSSKRKRLKSLYSKMK